MLKVLELYGGIGAPRKALENIGINVKTIDYVEWWSWAVKAYNNIFDHSYKTQDVREWNLNVDLLFHGSPCQDWSIAGKHDLSTGRSLLYKRTLEIIENELHPRPKYIVWENVTGLISKRYKQYFQHYLDKLEECGYKNYWKVLNAKDFGIPQSRNRIFVVSIRNDIDQEFDFDKLETKDMESLLKFIDINESDPSYFIKSESMKKAVQSGKIKIIDNISNNIADAITTKQDRWHNAGAVAVPLKVNNLEDGKVKIDDLTTFNSDNYVTLINKKNATIKTLQSNNRCKVAIPIENANFNQYGKAKIGLNNYIQESYTYDVVNPNTYLGTITTNIKQSKLAIPINNQYWKINEYLEFSNFFTLPRSSDGKTINGAFNRFWKIGNDKYVPTIGASVPVKLAIPIMEVNKDYDYRMSDGSKRPIGQINKEGKITIPLTNNHTTNKFGVSVIPTITTSGSTKVIIPAIKPIPGIPIFIIDGKPYHLRVLTPKETWLLMGFSNDDFNKVKTMPKTHLYHMAGNSIVVPVLESIFKVLLKNWIETT